MFRRPRPYITDPLPDPVPRGTVMVETAETRLLEAEARLRHAAHTVDQALVLYARREGRSTEDVLSSVGNALLDMRATLRPSPPGSEVLREGPPVQVGYAVPVIPGRAT